jgi:hypothetical protein
MFPLYAPDLSKINSSPPVKSLACACETHRIFFLTVSVVWAETSLAILSILSMVNKFHQRRTKGDPLMRQTDGLDRKRKIESTKSWKRKAKLIKKKAKKETP